jgi:hypothetical protein
MNNKYLLYNDTSKEITNDICIPQSAICDSELICCVDPTSSYMIGNTPSITNIVNNSGYSPGWSTYIIPNSNLAGFNSGGGDAAKASMISCVDSGSCEDNNLYQNVYVIGTNATAGNAAIIARNGPTGSTTGVLSLTPTLQNTTWLINYDTSGSARWIGGMGYTAAATNSSIYFMLVGSVCSYENSVYFNTNGSTPNNIFLLKGPSGAISGGITGFGGQGLTQNPSSPFQRTNITFFAKYDSSGNPIWVNRLANTEFRTDSANGLSCASYGDSVVQVGTARGGTNPGSTLVFNGPIGEFVGITGPSVNSNDGLIVKYDISGIAQWLGRVTSFNSGNTTKCTDVDIDEQENIYICGNYFSNSANGNIFFYDSPNGDTIGITGPTSFTIVSSFIAKYSPSGKSLWFKKIGTSGVIEAHSISYSNNKIYLSGIYASPPITIRDGPAPSNILLQAISGVSGTNDAFVAQFDTDGNPQWVGRIEGPNIQQASGTIFQGIVSVDSTAEGCYVNCVVGSITATINVYNGPTGSGTPSITATYPTTVSEGTIAVKFNSKGEAQWIVRFAQTSGNQSNNIASYGISASRNGIYFLHFQRTLLTPIKTFQYYTRNDGSTSSRTFTALEASMGVFINRIDFSENIYPTFTLTPNNTNICPTNKTITYRSGSAKTSIINPSGSTLVDPSFGLVSGITASSTGSTLNLLYNPTSNNDWFILKNYGFDLY